MNSKNSRKKPTPHTQTENESTGGKSAKAGKTKTKTSKRTVPLNVAAIEAIKELRAEYCLGEDTPLVCDENGGYTKPDNFRKRYYRILKSAGIKTKGLHSLRHTTSQITKCTMRRRIPQD